MASRQSAPACGGPGSWLSSATSRRCCTRGRLLQCPCCAARGNESSGHGKGPAPVVSTCGPAASSKAGLHVKLSSQRAPHLRKAQASIVFPHCPAPHAYGRARRGQWSLEHKDRLPTPRGRTCYKHAQETGSPLRSQHLLSRFDDSGLLEGKREVKAVQGRGLGL